MAITVADLKFYQSERMTDNADGGGKMTAVEIVSGTQNQIFDDLSDVDRAAGDVSVRKIFAAVTSAGTDKYLDAGVVVFQEPTDPAVTVCAFSTGSFYDQRADLKSRLEQSITRGARYNGWLYGSHLIGQRALTIWQRTEVPPVAAGARIELVARANAADQYSEFCWITRVSSETRTMYEVYNGQTILYLVSVLTCELAEPLGAAYTGLEPSRADPSPTTATALVYETRYNAEAVPLFGVRPTVESAGVGDFTVKIDSLYTPIIPTALSETALPDVNPGGDSPALIAGNSGTVAFTTTTQCVKPDAGLYLGTGCAPGTLSIAVSGATLTDDNGSMKLAGSAVGTVDYGNGVCRWNSACPNYGAASKTITFKPAARPLQVAATAAQIVTAENRGYVWVLTLTPIPAPQTLRVAYRVNNEWYVLTDQGAGRLLGADSAYGSGSLNFTTGTVTFSTGALPDVGSEIIYAWGTPTNYTARGGDPVDAPTVQGQTAHAGLAPGQTSVSWTVGVTTYTLDDSPAADGNLTGTGGVGFIHYGTGAWWVRPTTLPPVNTVFTIAYEWGDPRSQTFTAPTVDGDGVVHLQLTDTNILPGSVHFEVPLTFPGADDVTAVLLRRAVWDDGAGNLFPLGWPINYATGELHFNPSMTTVAAKKLYATVQTGTESQNGITVPTYRQTHVGWDRNYSVLAYFPTDGSGAITVHYRVSNSASAASDTVTLSQLEFDLTRGYGETIAAGSLRFSLGNSRYVDTAGQIYRDPAPDTGAGSLCGTVDRSVGTVRLTSWPQGGSNAVTLESLVTVLGGQPVDYVVFRAPVSPLKSGTLQLRYQQLDGTVKSKSVDGSGLLEDADCTIHVDYTLGVIRARFGLWKVDADLTSGEKLEPWYDPDHRVSFAGTLKIWKPKQVLADSILYNAVAATFLPPDSTLLGLNAARLPPDGRALIFTTGRLVLVHHTARITENSLSPTQVIDCGRVRLYRVVIEDSAGQRMGADQFTVNREAGTVTLSPTLNLTGTTAPYYIVHTVADLARLVDTDINGALSLNRALSHVYPSGSTRVSGVLYVGTLQARVSALFAQSSWDSVWQDTVRGSVPLAQYNATLYPIQGHNSGAYPDRFLIQFTSSTAFRVIGENLGLIAVGDVNTDCTPMNLLTGQSYFTVDHRGWGSGWATGNCLRFNLIGAAYPVDLIRACQPSDPTGTDDAVELLFIGNTDA